MYNAKQAVDFISIYTYAEKGGSEDSELTIIEPEKEEGKIMHILYIL